MRTTIANIRRSRSGSGGAHSALGHEIVGKTALGIGLGEQPRWG
ncbi:MAG TPA: hypothetical protein VGS17_13825 [Candidatus Limnocylindria bacterium]|nr:hypothetical protein [Candidatus Limnocylindria bacterium]